MTAIALVSVINHNHINGLHLFCDTLYMTIIIIISPSSSSHKFPVTWTALITIGLSSVVGRSKSITTTTRC